MVLVCSSKAAFYISFCIYAAVELSTCAIVFNFNIGSDTILDGFNGQIAR